MKCLLHRQIERRKTATTLDPRNGGRDRLRVGRRDHEPEIISVRARVIVIDERLGADEAGHLLEPLGRNAQRRKRAGDPQCAA